MQDAALASNSGRLAQREAIDQRLNQATQSLDRKGLSTALQAQGVPAGPVNDAADVIQDPQLDHRGHWLTLEHPEMGPSLYNAQPFRFSRSAAGVPKPAPMLGQHTEEICRELLGLSKIEIEQLAGEGALT